MILKKEAIEKLSIGLSLPYQGNEQDWDLEMANAERIDDFINYYLGEGKLSDDEKLALTALILASYEDFLNNGMKRDKNWEIVKEILKSNPQLYYELINYWQLGNTSEDDLYQITPLLREINLKYQ